MTKNQEERSYTDEECLAFLDGELEEDVLNVDEEVEVVDSWKDGIHKPYLGPELRFARMIMFKVVDDQKHMSQEKGKVKYQLKDLITTLKPNEAVSIWGGYGKNGLIDIDHPSKKVRNKMVASLFKHCGGKTFTVSSQSKKPHVYYYIDDLKDDLHIKECPLDKDGNIKKDKDGKPITAWELRAHTDKLTLTPIRNKHYEVFYDVPIVHTTLKKIKEAMKEWTWEKKKKEPDKNPEQKKPKKKTSKSKKDLIEDINNAMNFRTFLNLYNGITEDNSNIHKCPICKNYSGSKKKEISTLKINDDTLVCHRCNNQGKSNSSWNMWSYLEKFEGITTKKDRMIKLAELAGINPDDYKSKSNVVHYDYNKLADDFHEVQPYYYDTAKQWWLWDIDELIWKMVDETGIMVVYDDIFNREYPSNSSTFRMSLLEAVKKNGRRYQPEEPPETWIQFKDKIVDYSNGTVHNPTPKYFMCNVIPWTPKKGNTPNIDRIFKEWVGENYVLTLKQIAAYSMVRRYRLHRIVVLLGEGRNGKGSYLNGFVYKLLGEGNVMSSDFHTLKNNRFESSYVLYKSLACIMGDIDKHVMKSTGKLKAWVGDDYVRGEMKGKGTFLFQSYAKLICAANKMPPTQDTTIGYYSKWLILDFPNQFNEKKDIIAEIPDEEYEFFCGEVVELLQKLFEDGKFHGEGDYEERKIRYESKAGYAKQFMDEYCEVKEGAIIPVNEFHNKHCEYLNDQSVVPISKIKLGREMKMLGYESHPVKTAGGLVRCYRDIDWNGLFQEDELSDDEINSLGG